MCSLHIKNGLPTSTVHHFHHRQVYVYYLLHLLQKRLTKKTERERREENIAKSKPRGKKRIEDQGRREKKTAEKEGENNRGERIGVKRRQYIEEAVKIPHLDMCESSKSFLNSLKFVKTLGQGGFGVVRNCFCKEALLSLQQTS
ncbi:hypothetical protein OS493_012247 [Desmophyllum pertusum]|uniref:Protein kinase domain-containing protein n=1 Tax=Desmophyllum pertusum TaxID=174260 RepID=A0A9X0D5T1_9CNID|nr:hypothetical protein OS493_012247 [Desmophyllum pertusum]